MARYYYDDAIEERRDRRYANAWFPLLLIPLLLLAGYIGYGMAAQYDANQNTTQYGVGGAPPERVSPTLPASVSPTLTVTPEPTEKGTLTPTMKVSEVEGAL